MYSPIFIVALSYFLCEYNPRSKIQKTEDVVRACALAHFSASRVDDFIEIDLEKLEDALVQEFNDRFGTGRPLRYEIADKAGVGKSIKGSWLVPSRDLIRFQDKLNRITHREFEKLSAIVLKMLGCGAVFFTPESHDQGVDAFGYQKIVDPITYGVTHDLIWISQAKHYNSTRVTTADIRELVGSKGLLVAHAFATVDARYKELKLKGYAPTALAMITSEEIPSTVRRLAENGGIFVFAASDLFELINPILLKNGKTLKQLIRNEEKSIETLN
jgi:hypothetical protein